MLKAAKSWSRRSNITFASCKPAGVGGESNATVESVFIGTSGEDSNRGGGMETELAKSTGKDGGTMSTPGLEAAESATRII